MKEIRSNCLHCVFNAILKQAIGARMVTHTKAVANLCQTLGETIEAAPEADRDELARQIMGTVNSCRERARAAERSEIGDAIGQPQGHG